MKKYKLNKKLGDLEIVDHVWSSFQEGTEWKQNAIDNKVTTWKRAYDKKPYGGENPNRDMTVDETVRNYCNTTATSILQPFIETNDLVRFTSNTSNESDIKQAKITQDLLNYQITKKTSKFNLLDESSKLFVEEGFIVSKMFWDYRDKEIIADSLIEGYEKAEYKNIPKEDFSELAVRHLEKEEKLSEESVSENEDGTMNGDFVYVDLISEKPNFVNIPLEKVVWSPTASKISYLHHDCEYLIEQKIMSNSSLRGLLRKGKNGYKKFTEEEITSLLKNNPSVDKTETSLKSYRENQLRIWEQYKHLKGDSKCGVNNQIVFEFHGYMDIDEDGIDELVTIEVLGDKIIKLELNKYLNDMIPFNISTFDKIPFVIDTRSLPESLLTTQRHNTAIKRNMIDALAFGFNQNYIIEEGTFSPENKRKIANLKPGEYVESKKDSKGQLSNKIVPIQTDTISRDWMQYLQLLEQQAQDNTGITKYTQGTDSSSLNQTATGVSIVTQQSMKKIWKYTTTFIEEFIKPTIEAYLIMNKMYLSEVTFQNSQDEMVKISKDDIDVDSDVDINVSLKGFDNEKVNQMTQFLNLSAPLIETGAVTPDVLAEVTNEIAKIWELNKVSKMIDNNINSMQQQQANPMMQQQMMPQAPMDGQMRQGV